MGCEKEETTFVNNDTSIKSGLIAKIKTFNSEYADFSTYEEFQKFSNDFNKLSQRQKNEVLSFLNYSTHESIIAEAYKGMDALETREEFIDYLSDYSDHLYLMKLPDGDEQVEEFQKSFHSSHYLINKDRVIKIGDIFRKYIGSICVEGSSLEELEQIKSVESAQSSSSKSYVAVQTNLNEIEMNQSQPRTGTMYIWEETDNNSWCKNDRRAKLRVGTIVEDVYINDPWLGPVTQRNVIRHASVDPLRKGIPCIWYNYTTEITWNNFHTEYDQDYNGTTSHVTWTESDEEVEDNEIVRETSLWFGLLGPSTYFELDWTDIESDVTTRGLLPVWINVDETY